MLSSSRLLKLEAWVKRTEDKNINKDDIVFELQPVANAFISILIDFLKASAKKISFWEDPESISYFFFGQSKNSR